MFRYIDYATEKTLGATRRSHMVAFPGPTRSSELAQHVPIRQAERRPANGPQIGQD